MSDNLSWDKNTLRRNWQGDAEWRLTLLQVLLVVPRLLLFGYELLHCPRTKHGKTTNDEPFCENNGAPLGWLLQQWQEASSRRSCTEAASGPGELCCGCVFLFCVHSHLSHVSSAHFWKGAHPGAPTRCSLCNCTIDVAAAVLQQQHFLRYELCTHGAFTGGLETGAPISHFVEIDVWYMLKKKLPITAR